MSHHPSPHQVAAEPAGIALNPWLNPPLTTPSRDAPPAQVDVEAACTDVRDSRVEDDLEHATAPVTGPSAPHRHVPAPPAALQLPRRQHAAPAALWWVGAHGGSGESVLACLVTGSAAADHAWPLPSDGHGGPVPVMLIARTSAHGLTRTQSALTQWAAGAAGDVALLGLVLAADAPGRLPTPLRHLANVVAGGAPRIWRLPWVEAWRMGTPAEQAHLPAPVRRLARDVTRLIRP